MSCRYDREAEDYLVDGEPCKRDDYGDPTYHCTARRTCSQHIGPNDLTCARCVGRVRTDLRRIPEISSLMMTVALGAGVNSEAANLAAPGANPAGWSERRIAMRSYLAHWADTGRMVDGQYVRITEQQYVHARTTMADDDELHPYNVLGRWDLMLREDYHHPSDEPVTIENAADYIGRHLGRVAQDPEQDFPLLGREIRKVRTHLEAVLQDSRAPERGVPCPDCTTDETGVGPRLVREYGHWCEDADCEKFHFASDEADRWVCPREQRHEWSHEDYTKWLETRRKRKVS